MNIYRSFTALAIFLGLLFMPLTSGIPANQLAQPLLASGTSCVTGSPAAGQSVKLCFTSPQNNSSLSGDTTVTVSATLTGKPSGIQRMVYYLNGDYFLTDYQSPYTFSLPSSHWKDGSYNLAVEATLRSGFDTPRASLTLTFNNGNKVAPVNTNQFKPTSGTLPAKGAPFIFAAAGDGASGEVNSANVVKLIASMKPNLFIYLGDVYEKGTFAEMYNYYGTQGSNFAQFKSITDPTVGNHEYTNGGQAQDYFYYWDNIPSYYSFDAGGWHFITLNSNGSYVSDSSGSPQYKWLVSDLSAHPQACTIVYYHEPVYNIGQESSAKQMASIWALLAEHHVSIVLNGHDHDYQRWVPLDGQGKPSPTGITEFVAGGGGHGLQTAARSDSRIAYSSFANPTTFGALKFTLTSQSASFIYENTAGKTLDSGTIACQQSTAVVGGPEVPGDVSAASVLGRQIQVSWAPIPNDTAISGYTVYRDGQKLATVPEYILNYTDTAVQQGSTYQYSVDAFDQDGNSTATSPAATVIVSPMAMVCHSECLGITR